MSIDDRVRHSIAVERMFIRYVVWLVEVQGGVQPKSAASYCSCIRSVTNDFIGYDMESVHKHGLLTKTVDGLEAVHPHQKRRRDPLMQQHILQWSAQLDLTLHSHRVALAIAVTTFGTTSRFGDFCPVLLSDFDPEAHAVFEDVQLLAAVGFITIKDHKTCRRSSWAPKTMPLPDVTYPLVVEGRVYHDIVELLSCTSPQLPSKVILSPYFQLGRLMKLSGKQDSKTPLFHLYGGKPVYYDVYSEFVRIISERCGHGFIKPHSGRSGGMTAMAATGIATDHTLRTCGYMQSESTPLAYSEAATENQAMVLRAIADSTHTDLAIHHAVGKSVPKPTVREGCHAVMVAVSDNPATCNSVVPLGRGRRTKRPSARRAS